MKVKWPADDIGEKGERIFTDLVRRLEGIPYVVNFGTALGIHRDGRLIPTDTDIDVCVLPDALPAVRAVLSDWPLAKVRPPKGGEPCQLLWYPEELIVDFSVWKPHDDGWSYEKFTMPADMWDADWRDTPYGRVPLPNRVEDILESLYGDWRTPLHRSKP